MITGAASGFGLELARLAASKGLNLVITDVQREALDKVTAELTEMGVQVAALRGDVSRSEMYMPWPNCARSAGTPTS